jgi:hypothetical protein
VWVIGFGVPTSSGVRLGEDPAVGAVQKRGRRARAPRVLLRCFLRVLADAVRRDGKAGSRGRGLLDLQDLRDEGLRRGVLLERRVHRSEGFLERG